MAKSNFKAKKSFDKSRISNIPTSKPERVNSKNARIEDGTFIFSQEVTLSELAGAIGRTPSEIIKFLFMQGKMVTINSTLDEDTVGTICLQYDLDYRKEKVILEQHFEEIDIVDDPKDLVERAPVVTIMGHVDHGKTTLLDAIRDSRVVEGEFGGITQQIGAYQVEINGKKITFLDTPGHAAFTAMRARGAKITDLVVIVVAADDGVMPQTKEAIDHAKAANVPIIVAINKIDKVGADPDKIMSAMTDLGLLPEEWGGNVIYKQISALKKIGISELLETILVVAEMQELKANPKRLASGNVIEGRLDKNKGPMATLLVANGTLKTGDTIVAGTMFGRVRQMRNDLGQLVKEALPATPVEIMGLEAVPTAGDPFMIFASDKQAREIADKRLIEKVQADRRENASVTIDDLYDQIQEGSLKNINIIIKTDTQGSAEAIKGSLQKLQMEDVRVNVIRATAGGITESDVLLASASNAIIYGFNVRPDSNVRRAADENKVDIRLHNVIYAIFEEIEQAMKGMLKPIYKEVVTGQAEVRKLFKVSKLGTIAGSYITEGSIKRDCGVRLIRDGIVVFEGKLLSLKREQNDAKEVNKGFECGMMIENFNDIKEGDIIEGYVMEEIKRK
ncbi:MAG: translation initiation factor IF-2 [Erysipelotrichaceae bacterium]|nr:translation initiation factor IF-2 [Erysipelotrichaceae bacterium]